MEKFKNNKKVYKERSNIIIGKKYGHLTVLDLKKEILSPKAKIATIAYCLCDCGNPEIKKYQGSKLNTGKQISCGCLHKNNFHGMTGNRILSIWSAMINRCCNNKHQQFHNYGGRGITVCEEWKNDIHIFNEWAMSNGYSDNLTIERIDVNGNYCPENCTWITQARQAYNKRINKRYLAFGENLTVYEHAKREMCVVNKHTLKSRLYKGWDIEAAITTKKIPNGKADRGAKYKNAKNF